MRSLSADLKFGLQQEKDKIELIKQHLCSKYDEADFANTKDLYQDYYYPYDFEGITHKTAVEMKSRRNKKNTYPTTIIPVAKVLTSGVRQLFVFNFTDCIAYIEHNKEVFDKFVVTDITTDRYGARDIPKPHFHIPVGLLIDIS
jgi:hypothetical protein